MIHTILFSLYKGFHKVNRSEVMWMPGIKARRTLKERSSGVESWSDILEHIFGMAF